MNMRLYTLFFTFLFVLPATAQMQAIEYYEQPLESRQRDNMEWQVFPMHHNGLVLMRHESKAFGKTYPVEFSHLDTNMRVIFSKSVTLPSEFQKEVHWQDDQHQNLYAIAQEAEYSKKFHFFHLDLASQTATEYQAEFPFTFEIAHFQVSQQVAYIAGKNNSKWLALSFNMLDRSIKLLPHFFEDREEVQHIYHDSTRNELTFVIANKDHRKRKVFLQPYSSLIGGGKRVELVGRERELRKRTFVEAIALHPYKQKNDMWAIGAYSFEGNQYWQGLFVTKHEGLEQKSLTFYRFQDFANIFNHYSEKRRLKMKAKMQQYSEKDQEYTFERRMLWNPYYVETPNTIVLLLTGYHLQNPTNNNNSWQSPAMMRQYGYRYPWYPYNTRSNNVGNNMMYVYDYALAVGFEKQTGRLLWDNMMKLEEIEHQHPQNVVQTGFVGENFITAYLHDDKLYSQISYQRAQPDEPEEQETKTILDGKLVDKIEDEELHQWYGNNFLLIGVNRRMYVEGMDNNKRDVFFCAKLRYTPPKPDKDKDKDKNKKNKPKN